MAALVTIPLPFNQLMPTRFISPKSISNPSQKLGKSRCVTKMVSSEYAGKGGSFTRNGSRERSSVLRSSSHSDIVFVKIDSCLVVPPPKGRKLRAIVQFLGGAFIGAVPEVTYNYLIELLANEGFLVISVPYNVTFDHSQAAKEVYERFNACLDLLLASGLPDSDISLVTGNALLQVLIGSNFSEKLPKANAIISYNNKSASEAVPYFEQAGNLFCSVVDVNDIGTYIIHIWHSNALGSPIFFFCFSLDMPSKFCNTVLRLGPLTSQIMPLVEASPLYSMARNASVDAWKVLMDTTGAIIPDAGQEALVSLNKFVDQLPSVLNQVTQGVSEFRPTPAENCESFKRSYSVQHNLLVKFDNDAIDETDLLEKTLRFRVKVKGGTLKKVSLSGTHITPCIQEPKWQVDDLYTPADAIAQGLKTLSLNDTKVLSRTISDWFKQYEE